ncbi:HD domain-containing protein [Bacillus sp. DJP31]|uniref:HD domain-containing protein n=1 Tax=Bacillus sp. DJP31 TaxID=3409789 RepID=UPI003BB7EBAB
MHLIEKAKEFAKAAHQGQTRKLSDEPYFVHAEGVATILREAGLSRELIAAGYLHDTVEDTSATIQDIHELFGEKVAEIVGGNTEDKTKSWEERKSHTIEELKAASFEVKCLVVADKLDNLRSFVSEAKVDNNRDIWAQFKRGKQEQRWYFKGVASALFENTEEERIPAYFHTYQNLVDDFFK